jgi:glycosyltransferase involved in cell wall biosynthesis
LLTSVPTVDVIHDINFVHRPGDFPFFVRKYYNCFFPRFAQKAKRIITVSEYSKLDLVKTMAVESSKIDVVYNGCNVSFTGLTDDVKYEIRKKFTNGCPYFIYIGSRNPRKNIKGLLDAFEQFKLTDKQGYKLLFVGEAMWQKTYLSATLDKMQFKNDVTFTGRLSTEALQLVLASAQALVLVSFSEGFGIPLIEAMQCDVPVICSNVSALPEVAGDAALYVDPESIDQIAKALFQIADSSDLREDLILKGRQQIKKFSWDSTAKLVWESIEKALQ